MIDETAKSAKQSRSSLIIEALSRLDNTIVQVEDFILTQKGNPIEKPETISGGSVTYPMFKLITEIPDKIHVQADRLEKIFEDLKNELA